MKDSTALLILFLLLLLVIASGGGRGSSAVTVTSVSSNSSNSVTGYIEQTFGLYSSQALAIAECESGYAPDAYNPQAIIGSHAEGVFQILYPSTWLTTSYARQSPMDYRANIQAAYEIFQRDGYSWREWACQP